MKMSLSKKEKLEVDTEWEALKANALLISRAIVHQPVEFLGRTERTISEAKYPGIKLWWAPSGLLAEWKEMKELIPQASVAKIVR